VKPRLIVRPQAEGELVAARDWFERQRAGLGGEFVDEVHSTMSAVLTRPQSSPKVHGEMRRAMLHRFPYGVFFRVTTSEVVILGIVHGRRSPAQWRSRQ
jgi:plasmid stabilization system protein ParE